MGWKIPLVVTRAEGRSLQNFVDDVYGAPRTLQNSAKTVRDALNPGLFEGFAITHARFHWIFDWRLSERSLKRPVPVSYPVWVFILHSVVNGYGFSSQTKGVILRSRSGNGCDDQIDVDQGNPTTTERAIVSRFAHPGQEDVAWRAWCNTETSFKGPIEEYTTHDLMGEEVVFALMEELTGFRLDAESTAANDFEVAQVMQVVKPPGILARLFGNH